ncbi:MAG: hypothetical protein ACO1RX_02655 [Candidatus Sericytochromatia bacterium]
MLVFLVSLRTALIFGPGEVIEAQEQSGRHMFLRLRWPHAQALDDWEGYAVVVPERNEVWGACKPRLEDGELHTELIFAPQPIPPRDRRLFVPLMAAAGQLATSTTDDDEDEE